MKKYLRFNLASGLLISVLFLFVSCSSDDKENAADKTTLGIANGKTYSDDHGNTFIFNKTSDDETNYSDNNKITYNISPGFLDSGVESGSNANNYAGSYQYKVEGDSILLSSGSIKSIRFSDISGSSATLTLRIEEEETDEEGNTQTAVNTYQSVFDYSKSNGTDPALKAILVQYVDSTVLPTYSNLAVAAADLESALSDLKTDKTQDNVQKACDAWADARVWYEQSEAFLFGPAAQKGIDPHIDTWPLDKTALDNFLASSTFDNFDAIQASKDNQAGLLGFHAIEYVLFRDGNARAVGDIPDKEIKFAYAVSGDLKLQTYRLKALWGGTLTSEEKTVINDAINQLGTDYAIDMNWGNTIKTAGESGNNIYKTQKDAFAEILNGESGCSGIANEVGTAKIYDPANSHNVLDVESWYSWHSKYDFQNNIRGIENSYLGGISTKRNLDQSIYAYLKKYNSTLADKVKASIANCIGEDGTTGLGKYIVYPFRNHIYEADYENNVKAMQSCTDLRDVLTEAAVYIKDDIK